MLKGTHVVSLCGSTDLERLRDSGMGFQRPGYIDSRGGLAVTVIYNLFKSVHDSIRAFRCHVLFVWYDIVLIKVTPPLSILDKVC